MDGFDSFSLGSHVSLYRLYVQSRTSSKASIADGHVRDGNLRLQEDTKFPGPEIHSLVI